VVAEEDLDQRGDDRREAVQVLAAEADGGDRLLGLVGREREERGDVGLPHVLGGLLGDLLDVAAPHVAEDGTGMHLVSSAGGRGAGERNAAQEKRRAVADEEGFGLVLVEAHQREAKSARELTPCVDGVKRRPEVGSAAMRAGPAAWRGLKDAPGRRYRGRVV